MFKKTEAVLLFGIGLFLGALLLGVVSPRPESLVPSTAPAPTQTARVEYVVVTATPNPALGWINTESVVVIGHIGEYINNVAKVGSINAQGWAAYASCPGLKGVEFHPASGGLSSGSESEVRIQIHDSATVGYCEGEIVVVFWDDNGREERHTVKFQLTVLP